jgi:hypothetical protein
MVAQQNDCFFPLLVQAVEEKYGAIMFALEINKGSSTYFQLHNSIASPDIQQAENIPDI